MQLLILNQLFISVTQKKIRTMIHFVFLFSIHLSKPVLPHWEDLFVGPRLRAWEKVIKVLFGIKIFND